jgi:hypothetical protein
MREARTEPPPEEIIVVLCGRLVCGACRDCTLDAVSNPCAVREVCHRHNMSAQHRGVAPYQPEELTETETDVRYNVSDIVTMSQRRWLVPPFCDKWWSGCGESGDGER